MLVSTTPTGKIVPRTGNSRPSPGLPLRFASGTLSPKFDNENIRYNRMGKSSNLGEVPFRAVGANRTNGKKHHRESPFSVQIMMLLANVLGNAPGWNRVRLDPPIFIRQFGFFQIQAIG